MSVSETASLRPVLAVAQPLGVAAVMTAVGAVALGPPVSSAWVAAAVVGLLVFLALLTFKRTRGWNLVLLALFAAIAGGFMTALFPRDAGWGAALALVVLVMSALASIGRFASNVWLARVAWVLSWLYVVGWPVLVLLGARAQARIGWAVGGLLVFACLAACWFAGRPWRREEDAGTPLAIEIYVIALNLMFAGAGIVGWAA